MSKVVAVDIGFGFTKATNGDKSLIYKSVYGDATDVQFSEHFATSEDGGENMHIDLEGKSYFVGELAEIQSSERRFTLDQQQFIDEFTRILTLPALASLAGARATVSLVLGLPISHYRRYKDSLQNQLAGTHVFQLTHNDGTREDARINIDRVKVVPQPFGTVLNLMLDGHGEIQDRRFVQEKVAVIDVGFRTTDFTISDRAKYSERGSRTIDFGISRAFSNIASRLQEISGINVELYRLYEAVERGWVKIHGKRYDINPVREHAFEQLASSIASQANQLWVNDWDIDRVVITGGGGAALAEYFQSQINGKIVPIDPAQDTRLNNVQGYHKYGVRHWQRASDTQEQAESMPTRSAA